jgi:hypothetical protein
MVNFVNFLFVQSDCIQLHSMNLNYTRISIHIDATTSEESIHVNVDLNTLSLDADQDFLTIPFPQPLQELLSNLKSKNNAAPIEFKIEFQYSGRLNSATSQGV